MSEISRRCFRTIPLAILGSMLTVTVLYVLVNVSYYTVMTPDELLASEAVAVVSKNKKKKKKAHHR